MMEHSRNPPVTSQGCGAKKLLGPTPPQPCGFFKPWAKIEALFSYTWLVIQVLLLIAGLTVLHFSTFMVTLSYCIYGYIKRREFSTKDINITM